MSNYTEQLLSYETALFNIKSDLINADLKLHDQIWMNHFNLIKDSLDDLNNLPTMLALIHPEFCAKNGINFKTNDNLQLIVKANFTDGIRHTDSCQFENISGYKCIYEKIRGREKVQADHFWPNSLGGPSILENRLLLCKYHNSMKSNNISSFKWDVIPTWLSKQILTISLIKSSYR